MVAALDVTGHRYGRLIALHRVASPTRRTLWKFICDCGTTADLKLERVRSGMTKSCGCLRIDKTRERSLKHGHSINRTRGGAETRTLKAYRHAKSRCTNPRDHKYPRYGARGIRMCDAWAADFSVFLADMGECPPGMTLDRIDVNGHYEPGNCRWATPHQQARTRSDNVLVRHDGRALILKDFASLMGVNYKALHARVRYKGQDPHSAATELATNPHRRGCQ